MPTSSNYLCGCGRFMRPKQNSVTVEELHEDGTPYKLWNADLWECPECGTEIISGFGRNPIAEHYQPTYSEQRARVLISVQERLNSHLKGCEFTSRELVEIGLSELDGEPQRVGRNS